MKRLMFVLIAGLIMTAWSGLVMAQDSTQVQAQTHGANFVDEDGDGINDNRRGGVQSATQTQDKGKGPKANRGFVDMDGDGLNDLAQDADGDGIPNGQDEDYVKPGDGSGNGRRGNGNWQSGSSGSGDCDGSGSGSGQSKGKGGRRGGGKK